MSFQGDVAGIGLGELLQGLARGGRDGVLTLDGRHLSAAVGLRGGKLFILEGPDESPDTWRERAERAWAHDQNNQLEGDRRHTIAKAHRLELIYRMLEADNLRFRFEPGPLPAPRFHQTESSGSLSLAEVKKEADENAWGPPLTVEYLLLEHARIADETSKGPAAHLADYDMPRAFDASQYAGPVRDFLSQCDGNSTLQEISDRLGIPLTLCRSYIGEHLRQRRLRIAEPRELLASAQREMDHENHARAATRITGWLERTPAGIPPAGDAQLLLNEIDKGRVRPVLALLAPKDARCLLRRLDHTEDDPRARRRRWRDLHEAHRTDEITLLRDIALRLVSTDEPEGRTYHDLLRLARAMQDRGLKRRTRTLLRLAANNLPPRPQTRVELGRRMLEAGLLQEGKAWLLQTGREMLTQGDGERASQALREVLKRDANHEEATGLLIQAQHLLAKKRRRRWNAMAGLSIGLTLSLVALVKFHRHRKIEQRIDEISALLHTPEEAMAALQEAFPGEKPDSIRSLAARVETLVREDRRARLENWNQAYRVVEEECLYGDPILALRKIVELPDPPRSGAAAPERDERQDLLGLLASRLGERSHELDLPVTANPDDLKGEERLVLLIDELVAQVDPDASPEDLRSFRFRMEEMREQILDRRADRAEERQYVLQKEKAQEQDVLLATARAHEQAGDLQRALVAYDRLLESDPELRKVATLVAEIEKVRAHWDAVQTAVALAEEGRHEEAAAELRSGACPRPIEHMLPWRVDSRPSGARVKMPYGEVRTTPFLAQSGIGEPIRFTLELPGYETREITVNRPQELLVHLHRKPERAWKSDHRIETVPVPVGDDHVVADRFGRIRRLSPDSVSKWERNLSTLGGIARTPVFLPEKPGYLLILSEDGQAWLVHSGSGEVVGPRDIGSPPRAGPILTRSGVTASFADGRVAVWSDGLEPTFYATDGLARDIDPSSAKNTAGATICVLDRITRTSNTLHSKWSEWSATVLETEYRVVGPGGLGFTARREGEWVFLAWEAPNALIPSGRLWISDEEGLRAYRPETGSLVRYEE